MTAIKTITKLRAKYGDLCHLCNLPMNFGMTSSNYDTRLYASKDHLEPLCLGGKSISCVNIRLAHGLCNHIRGRLEWWHKKSFLPVSNHFRELLQNEVQRANNNNNNYLTKKINFEIGKKIFIEIPNKRAKKDINFREGTIISINERQQYAIIEIETIVVLDFFYKYCNSESYFVKVDFDGNYIEKLQLHQIGELFLKKEILNYDFTYN